MGMYDNINFEMPCPNCKTKIEYFQSKSGSCLMNTLEFWEVENFYAGCSYCNTWVEFNIKGKRPNRKLTLKDYHRGVKIPSKKDQIAHRKGLRELAKLFVKGEKKE